MRFVACHEQASGDRYNRRRYGRPNAGAGPAIREVMEDCTALGASPRAPTRRRSRGSTMALPRPARMRGLSATVEATDKREAIEKAAKEFGLDPTKLMAERRP